MKHVFELWTSDREAGERFRAVLRAAVSSARSEQKQDPKALMFIGAFGVRRQKSKNGLVVDLCQLTEALLFGTGTGHDLVISLVDQDCAEHVSRYVKERLTDEVARTVYIYLNRHPDEIPVFTKIICPTPAHRPGTNVVDLASENTSKISEDKKVCS